MIRTVTFLCGLLVSNQVLCNDQTLFGEWFTDLLGQDGQPLVKSAPIQKFLVTASGLCSGIAVMNCVYPVLSIGTAPLQVKIASVCAPVFFGMGTIFARSYYIKATHSNAKNNNVGLKRTDLHQMSPCIHNALTYLLGVPACIGAAAMFAYTRSALRLL